MFTHAGRCVRSPLRRWGSGTEEAMALGLASSPGVEVRRRGPGLARVPRRLG